MNTATMNPTVLQKTAASQNTSSGQSAVEGAAVTSVNGKPVKPFAAVLQNAVSGQKDSDAADSPDLLAMLGGIPLYLLLNVLPQLEQGDPKKTASSLTDALSQQSSALQKAIVGNPALQSWLNETARVILAMNPNADQSANPLAAVFSVQELAALGEDQPVPISQEQMKMILKQLAVKSAPADGSAPFPAVRLETDLKAALQSVFADLGIGSIKRDQGNLPNLSSGQGTEGLNVNIVSSKRTPPLNMNISNPESLSSASAKGAAAELTQTAVEPQVNIVRQHPIALLKAMDLSSKVMRPLVDQKAEEAKGTGEPVSLDGKTVLPSYVETMFNNRSAAGTAKPTLPVVQAQQFVEDMSRVMLKNMKISQLDGISEARITLVPEHLGKLDVRITMHNGQMIAQFVADTLHAKDMLESQMPQLRAALQNHGLQVEKLEVTQQNGVQTSLFQDHRDQSSARQFFRQPSKKQELAYDSFNETMLTQWDEGSMQKSAAYGSSFYATV
ncbi:flagellar hook-length control protein FliK [Ferviditalea candida]|uniref:Flagellar hook-length control protein FliK n=1 Tax=Ferviditalea candida TaxID=3108399 RepID=A0ABU5ZHL4_9BACL|nr:flagellar hook-length control protein FliK [Paenibacillaceae bacterium T2]